MQSVDHSDLCRFRSQERGMLIDNGPPHLVRPAEILLLLLAT